MVASKNYAGFGVRLVAAVIDGVILGIASSLLSKAMPFMKRPILGSLPGALYSILLWVNWKGQTIGKRAMGIKVVQENGKALEYKEAIIRYLCYFVSAIPLCLGFFWVLADDKKQGWHDKIAKTLVVKE
jgi:uncharacterized RDD family membrane protein YckC